MRLYNRRIGRSTSLRGRAAVILVADIDRGGAFAHLWGTWSLLPERQRSLIKGFVLNKFRGDQALLEPAPAELERFLSLYDLAEKQGDSFESAIKLPLQAILVSPHFLFRIERSWGRLNDHELASRLSYFLWSTMPDSELFDVAEKGTLHEPAVLEAQVHRMLKDPKAASLAENFAIQWLQLRRLESQAPDPQRFPAWDEKLRAAMHDEAVLLFEEIVRDDKSVLDLLGTVGTCTPDPLRLGLSALA